MLPYSAGVLDRHRWYDESMGLNAVGSGSIARIDVNYLKSPSKPLKPVSLKIG